MLDGLLSICNWINRALTAALEFFVSLPGMIVTFFTTLTVVVLHVVSFFGELKGASSVLVSAVDSRVFELSNSSFVSSPIWALFSYMGALDVAFDYLISLGGVFLGFVGLSFATLLSGVIGCFTLVFTINITQKIVRLVSAGFLNA